MDLPVMSSTSGNREGPNTQAIRNSTDTELVKGYFQASVRIGEKYQA